MIADKIRNLPIEYFMDLPFAKDLEKMLEMLEKTKQTLYSIASSEDEKGLLKIRIGTVLTFAMLTRIASGKSPSSFTKEDWMEIADAVSEYAVNVDDKKYSEYVFLLYADYIRTSAGILGRNLSSDTAEKIYDIAESLKEKARLLEEDKISEPAYIEDCMWLALEGMIKLLAASIYTKTGEDIGRFVEGISAYAFEYGRLVMYRKEQILLETYLEEQNVLDAELEIKYNAFLDELQIQADSFKSMVENAFNPDFSDNLKGSIELALAAGVKEEEILKSTTDIDAFFLD